MYEVNQRVEVVVVYKSQGSPSNLVMPAKMKYKGTEVIFTELGLRHPTKKGHRMIHVFDMFDGTNDYRLEFDAEMLTWTLIAILEGAGK